MSERLHPRAKVITSLNLKGGVGKTHLCWLIASVCQEQGLRCLVLDLDKQGNITSSLLPNYDGSSGTEQFFNPAIDAEIAGLIRRTEWSHLDVIPGSFALERFNMTDPDAWKDTGLQLSLSDPINEVRPLYDFILLDCPPDISLVTYAALCASDFVIVPLEAAQWGALGTQHVVKTYRHVCEHFNAQLRLLGFVVSRYKRVRKYQQAYLGELRTHFGDDAFVTMIPDLSAFEQSVNDRVPITLHSPHSYASSIARDFFDEVQSRIARHERIREAVRSSSLRQPVVAPA